MIFCVYLNIIFKFLFKYNHNYMIIIIAVLAKSISLFRFFENNLIFNKYIKLN